jgi:TonB family protein
MSAELQAELQKYPREPVPIDPSSWVQGEDYPVTALISGLKGVTSVEVQVNAFGEAAGCVTTESSGVRLLDQRACSAITTRARFYPALDEKQQPVAGLYRTKVRWQVEEAEGRVADASHSIQAQYYGPGRLTDCQWRGGGAPLIPAQIICDKLNGEDIWLSDVNGVGPVDFLAPDDVIEEALAEAAD